MMIYCDVTKPAAFLLSDRVPELVYFIDIALILFLISIGGYVFLKNRKGIIHQAIFFINIEFALWVFLDLIFWAANRSDIIMFSWGLAILIEPLIYFSCLNLIYIFFDKKNDFIAARVIWILLYAPITVVAITGKLFYGFEVQSCIAIESFLSYYTYLSEFVCLVWISAYSYNRYHATKNTREKRQVLFLGAGTILSLLLFTIGNITGSYTNNWYVAKIGLIGIPIFMLSLSYIIVRYTVFNIRLLGVQVLSLILGIINFSLFFIKSLSELHRTIIFFTGLVSILIGVVLIKIVKNEIILKQKMISIATHHLGTPLTVIKGYVSLIRDKHFGNVSEQAGAMLEIVDTTSDNLSKTLHNFFAVSSLDNFDYRLSPSLFNFESQILAEFSGIINDRISIFMQENGNYNIYADRTLIHKAIASLIEYCVKTDSYQIIKISLSDINQWIVLKVNCGGVKNIPLSKNALIIKYTNAENQYENDLVLSDFGLLFAKKCIELHGGILSIVDKTTSTEFKVCLPRHFLG